MNWSETRVILVSPLNQARIFLGGLRVSYKYILTTCDNTIIAQFKRQIRSNNSQLYLTRVYLLLLENMSKKNLHYVGFQSFFMYGALM